MVYPFYLSSSLCFKKKENGFFNKKLTHVFSF
ncbi:hypothetical protein YPC_4174 [Yersinia pestis biovar Medievalis str. Harbin 35]|nr:hypothetical protein YPC_4174 [Yersinia pestis biovar Medievalis str. Harbin 35]EEO78078.1 hypothetical protein YP516_0296 [Yersinia pestis Nepal516]EEO82749.1 hypothetical protein YPF_0721 [Yersinia pestis biovar Orientalis str. India 195]EEO86719.1 hypothetical protein YPH_2640 [Yersinia pestis biovar Orientalis str. PEXU2]EEO91948.1 hypothetical protein YPS_0896 [Yersinia pestis Pestoides A]